MDQELVAVAVDDETMILSLIEEIAREAGIKVISFSTPEEALAYIRDNEIDMVFTDYRLPGMNGIEFIVELRKIVDDIPILMITVFDDYNIMMEAIKAGATEFIPKPINAVEFLARVRNLSRLRIAQLLLKDRARQLESEVRRELQSIKEREQEAILVLGRALEFKDSDEDSHDIRVARYAKLLARGAGMDAQAQEIIYYASLLHDIGKTGVNHEILLKEGPLTDEEMAVVRNHSMIGSKILDNAKGEYLKTGGQVALTHHEHYDGKGYPRGLKGDQIPLAGRIVALADVFDSLTSKRPFREPWDFDTAIEYIRGKSGSHFDPYLVEVFIRNIEEAREIYMFRT